MDNTADWDLYQQGIDYKNKLNLFVNVNRNERFYAGHHWDGVDTGGLPQVRLNLTKRIVNWKVAQIMSDMLTMQFSADNSANYDPKNPDAIKELQQVASQLSDYSKTTWERLKQDSLNEQALLDCALSGDGVSYFFWDDSVNAGTGVMGDVQEELIDNVCYFPGNTSEPRPNDKDGPLQPYIILAFRKQVQEVKDDAKYYATHKDPSLNTGLSQSEIDQISADNDTMYRAGDRARQEPTTDKGGGWCTVLLKMWVKDGTIWARKSVRSVVFRKDWDTGLHRYPVAAIGWLPRKNSCHGEAEATELIPNNIAINKLMATMILWTMLMAYPKPIYDSGRIPAWSNDITKAVPVDGDVTGAAMFLQPPGLPPSVMTLFSELIAVTKEMAGANETALGESSLTKAGYGIVALQKAALVPLSTIKRKFSQYIEDIGMIWLDFWLTKYNVNRILTIDQKGQKMQIPFDGSQYSKTSFSLKVDVGPSNQWSELASLQTLESLLTAKMITFKQYLERVQSYGIVPDAQELIDELDQQEQQQQAQQSDKQFLYELMARHIDTLPPDQQAQIRAIKDPVQMEAAIKQMMVQNPQPQAQAQPQQPAQPQQVQKGPSMSMSFKDLPPEGKVQMAAQAGIQLSLQQAAAMNSLPTTGGVPNGLPPMQPAPNGQQQPMGQ